MRNLLGGLVALGIFIPSAFSDVIIATWDFGPDGSGYTEITSVENVVGTPTLMGMSAGTGYSTEGQSGVSFTDAEGGHHAAGQALAWGSGVNDGDQEWIMNLNLTGYQELTLRWDYRSTGTGPSGARLEYKVGAESWTLIEVIALSTDASYHEYLKDLSTISSIENQSEVQFRLSDFGGGSGGGTHRIDNLQLSTVPEPATVAVFGVGVFVVWALRRLSRAS